MTTIRPMPTLPVPSLALDAAREVLLPPTRMARIGAVTLARTLRHWELVLAGESEPATATAAAPSTPGGDELRASDLPVTDWAELSLADAQARLSACSEAELSLLLDYERAHGRRMDYVLLLEHRIEQRGG